MPPRSPSVPTILEVADQAGVSIKTVSRVMNNEANVRPETRERVLEVVAQLKYRPKLSARSLPGGRSFVIGLLYYDPSAAFVASVQRGATMRCRELGYHFVVESFAGEPRRIAEQLDQMLAALRPDGMILIPPLSDNPHLIKALRDAGTPFVLLAPGRSGKKLPHVRVDDERGAAEVAELFVRLGHRRIGMIEGPADQSAAAARRKGFERALQAQGLVLDERWVVQGDFSFASGVAAGEMLLRRRSVPTAVFAANDDMALGLMAAAQRKGVSIPAQLSVAGFDDAPGASLVWPGLTTVRQPLARMGAAAVDMLLDKLEEASTACVLPHETVVRASTAAVSSARGRAPSCKPRGLQRLLLLDQK